MKKILLVLLTVIFLFPDAGAQFIRKWERSSALGNLPSWFSSTQTTERGIAYYDLNGSPRLFVVSNKNGPAVIILNALTGDSTGTLNTSGISGGDLVLSDISTEQLYPWGTKIYACNYTSDPTNSHFKIYMWENETAVPEVVVVDSVSNFALGEHLSLLMGTWGLFESRFVTAVSNSNTIVEYTSVNAAPPFTRRIVLLNDVNMGTNASVDFSPWYPYYTSLGGYFVNSDGYRPKAYDISGALVNISSDTLISAENNTIKYYANGTLCCDLPFYTTYNFAENKAELVFSSGYIWEYYWGSTPSLGSNSNPQKYGDLAYTWRASDTLIIFILAGNNGIAAYHANGLMTPVELISFNAAQNNNAVLLSWSTATESNNKGFEIEKKTDKSDWLTLCFSEGKGTTTEITNYYYIDNEIIPGKLFYRLKQIDYDGSFTYSDILEIEIQIPQEYTLLQNYPNPFNPVTIINYSVPEEAFVNLSLYNVLGEKVLVLKNEVVSPGNHSIELNASNLKSGIYFYTITAGRYIQTKKMVLMR